MAKKDLVVKKKKELKKVDLVDRPFVPGDMLITRDGSVLKVGKCTKKGFELLHRYEDDWSHYGSCEWGEQKREKYMKLEKPLEEYEQDLIKELASDFSSFDNDAPSSSTDVVISGGRDQALSAKRQMEMAHQKLAMLNAVMERKKNQLENLKRHYADQLESITRVVDIIELYLGVTEEIVQIQEGEPSPENEPICFRQLVLHMDEEVADTSTGKRDKKGASGGIDFERIDEFDAWVRLHIDQVLPEQKGVVVMRPRRTEKDYRLGDNVFDAIAQAELNKENFRTYILIRNGKNLYRINSDKIQIYPVLFPSPDEMRWLQTGETNDEDKRRWYKEEDAQLQILGYKRNVLMLQGLLDRTTVFNPRPMNLNLLQPDTYGKSVRFIYDGSSLLGDGRPSFRDWLKQLNGKVQRGHRLYFTEFPWSLFSKDYPEERRARYPIPGWDKDRPGAGIYNVVRMEKYSYGWRDDGGSPSFICHFNPKDTVYKKQNRWEPYKEPSERKMSIPFRLFPDDEFVINYEDIDPSDIEFYLKDRVNRKEYLKMMPVLRGIKEQKLKEHEWEQNFARFLSGRIEHPNSTELESRIWEAIKWWKTKVIDKRPLKKEDAKAVRMIEQRVRQLLRGR